MKKLFTRILSKLEDLGYKDSDITALRVEAVNAPDRPIIVEMDTTYGDVLFAVYHNEGCTDGLDFQTVFSDEKKF